MAVTDKKAGLYSSVFSIKETELKNTIEIQGKPVSISTSQEADAILSSRNIPLVVEMELLFDSLVREKVRVLTPSKSGSSTSTVSVGEKLSTRFRP